jgi:hypothetical protein
VSATPFSRDPAELAHFLAAEAKSYGLQLDDTGDQLAVRPVGFPMWVVWASLAVPTVTVIVVALYRIGTGRADSLEYVFYAFAVVALPANWLLLTWFFRWLNSKQLAHGPHCVLDRVNRTLTLPRAGRTIAAGEVLGFVQFHGWHTTTDDEGTDSDWMAELTVLVAEESGEVGRLPVVGSMRSKVVNQLGKDLAAFFDRPRQVIGVRWWERIRP